MTVVAEITTEFVDLPLEESTSDDPPQTVEFERLVPSGTDPLPFFWVHGGDPDEFETHARESGAVEELTALDRLDGHVLYRVVWQPEVQLFLGLLADIGGVILDAAGTDRWRFRLRFDEHRDLAAFHARCQERGIRLHLQRIAAVEDYYHEGDRFGLTRKQHEALLVALERGYFTIPRQTSLAEVATSLGISQQSASERIRRGTSALLQTALLSRAVPQQASKRDRQESPG
jgi:predicted DNA-binding protein YlxM (UPF0122 family)